MTVEIYTDGSSRGNPGPGGYGVYMEYSNGDVYTLSMGYFKTTNNRMELMAFYRALEYMYHTKFKGTIHLFTDSKYVSNAINEGWLTRWVSEDFRNRVNEDIWRKVAEVIPYFKGRLKVGWVRGHSNISGNVMADKLATMAADNPQLNDTNYAQTNSRWIQRWVF